MTRLETSRIVGRRRIGPRPCEHRIAGLAVALGLALAPLPAAAVKVEPGDILVTDSLRRALFLIDPVSGDREVVSSRQIGSGKHLQYPLELALLPPLAGSAISGTVLIADQNRVAIVSVDLLTGDRGFFSSREAGHGVSLGGPKAIAFSPAGYYVVADSALNAVLRIEMNGDRRMLSMGSTPGVPSLRNPLGIAVEPDGSILVVDNNRRALFRIDPTSGNRTVVSSQTVGAGTDFIDPVGIAIEREGHIVVADKRVGVFRVDLATGERVVVSSRSVGHGPLLDQPFGIAVEANGQILVVDRGPDLLVRVDPDSGDRAVASGPDFGVGEPFGRPRKVIVIPGGRSGSGADENDVALLIGVIGVALAGGVIWQMRRARAAANGG